MGVLQNFEKRLENLVEGAFARVFKGVVHPVEIASAMQREADAHKSVLGGGRVLVPNRYIIDLSPSDHDQLAQYAAPLAQELAQAQAEFIGEQGWMVYGDVIVEIERGDGLDTGMFRIAAEVYTGGVEPQAAEQQGGWGQQGGYQPDPYQQGGYPGGQPAAPGSPIATSGAGYQGYGDYGQPGAGEHIPTTGAGMPGIQPGLGAPTAPVPGIGTPVSGGPQYGGYAPADQGYGSAAQEPEQGGYPQGGVTMRLITADGRQFSVAYGATIIGRGEGAQVRLADVGISRQHARLDFDGNRVVLTDLGSTNGTMVNGNRINAVTLQHGDVIQLGTTTLTFRMDG